MIVALAVVPLRGAPVGTAQGEYNPTGNIFLDINAVAQYKAYVGDAAMTETAGGIDALSLDGVAPFWLLPGSLKEDKVDGFPNELWAETVFGGDLLSTPGLTWMDGGVNVDTSKLGPDVRLWLRYQLTEGSQQWTEIVLGPPTFAWQGGSDNWAAANWHDGTTPDNFPQTGAPMIVDADTGDSDVTVNADFNSARSLVIGANYTAGVGVNSGVTLYVDNNVSVQTHGTLSVTGSGRVEAGGAIPIQGRLSGDGTVAGIGVAITGPSASLAPGASIGTINVIGDCSLEDSATYEVELRGNDLEVPSTTDNDKVAISGQLAVDPGTTLSLDWLPTDATSKFGGTYRLATYTGSEITGLDETDMTFAGSIGEAYVGGVDFGVELGGSDYAVDLLLHDLLAADANLDGVVDGLDFAALVGNWRTSGKTWPEADFNFDGNVDGLDFAALVGSWRDTAGPRGAGGGPMGLGTVAVPEPSTLVLLGMGALALLAYAHRKRRRR